MRQPQGSSPPRLSEHGEEVALRVAVVRGPARTGLALEEHGFEPTNGRDLRQAGGGEVSVEQSVECRTALLTKVGEGDTPVLPRDEVPAHSLPVLEHNRRTLSLGLRKGGQEGHCGLAAFRSGTGEQSGSGDQEE